MPRIVSYTTGFAQPFFEVVNELWIDTVSVNDPINEDGGKKVDVSQYGTRPVAPVMPATPVAKKKSGLKLVK
jgi:hypothetical protein